MSPLAIGVAFAILAAVAFGVTARVIAWAGAGLGPFSPAALLYLGAALMAATIAEPC